MTIYERIDLRLGDIGKTRKDMAKSTGIPYSTLANMKHNKSAIKLNTLTKIANYLDVSIDWLSTGEQVEVVQVDKNAHEILRIYNSLSLKNKAKLMVYAYELEGDNNV